MLVDVFLLLLILLSSVLLSLQGQWTPRSRFWKEIQKAQAGLYFDGEDHWDSFQSCIDEQEVGRAPALPVVTTNVSSLAPVSLQIVNQVIKDSKTGVPILMEIQNAFSAEYADIVRGMAICVQRLFPKKLFKSREFGKKKGGGNEATFLNHILPLFAPEIPRRVQEIAELAFEESSSSSSSSSSWKEHDYPPPGQCGIRTSEYLNYTSYKSLGEHGDYGSIYTVIYALSKADSYQGGEFFIKNSDGEYHYLKPQQYSALVFLSDSPRGVTDIESGHREMYTNEYWKYDDPPFPRYRPRLERMEMFLELCENSTTSSFQDVPWPSGDELDAWLRETGREGLKNGRFEKKKKKKKKKVEKKKEAELSCDVTKGVCPEMMVSSAFM